MAAGLQARWHRIAERTLDAIDRHPRALSSVVMLSLATFGATAFGVVPDMPDPARLPQRVIVETLALSDLAAQRDALALHQVQWHRTTETRPSDSLASLFKRLDILDNEALTFAAADADVRRVLEGRSGRRVQARAADDGRLIQFVARMPAREAAMAATHFSRLTIERDASGALRSKVELVALGRGMRAGSGTIRSSLFAATEAANLPDVVAVQIAEIFASDIDFHRELRKGDHFRVVYETLTADDEPVTWNEAGRVLAAEFVNNGEKHDAMWFQHSEGRGGYYDFLGNSHRRAFLASPLEFSRVTSGFSMRFHPILQSWRKHLGTDYAAPTGTPVRAVGDGVIEFAGVQNGYGNVVVVKHSQQRSTLYAHLSRIDVRVGQGVGQGDRIGAVGSTGWSTGPHLHFEFKVAGEHRDPVAMAKASEALPLAADAKATFLAQASVYVHKLGVAASVVDGRPGTE